MEHTGRKEDQVKKVFSAINNKYDLIDSLISFGLDQHWRSLLINGMGIREGSTVIDCGAGTGKLTETLGKRCPTCSIISVDITVEMYRKPKNANARFLLASAESIPLPDNSADYIMSSYLTRNLSDVSRYFREAFRLLRSGGTIGNLDIYNPTAPGFSQLFGAYFYHLVPFVGNSLTGSKAYSYLAKSVLNFYSPGRVSELLKEAGFVSVRMKPMMLGAIVLHWGMKP